MFSKKAGIFSTVIFSFVIFILLPVPAFSQELNPVQSGTTENSDKTENKEKTDIDMYSLEDLLNVEIEVASLFAEDELVVGSTVSSISSNKWKQLGARRTHEVLNNEMSVSTTPNMGGFINIAIRGYANSESRLGIATMMDGIPMNFITIGSAFDALPNFELGILDKVEIIKGPGSSIYGSDAFHGVLLLKTFESDKNCYSIEGAGAYPLYGDANAKISQGLFDNLIRIDAAASISRQGDQDLEYDYDDNGVSGTGTRENSYDSKAGIFKLRINPVDKIRIKLTAFHGDFESKEFPGGHVMELNNIIINLRDDDISSCKSRLDMGSGSIEYLPGSNISIEANGYYRKADIDITLQATPDTSAILPDARITQYGVTNQSGANITAKQPTNALNLQWLIAYSFARGEITSDPYDIISDTGTYEEGTIPSEGFVRIINSVFSQVKWGTLDNTLFFLLGGRLDSYSDKGSEITPKDFGTQFSPRGGIIFLPTQKSSVKALYGRAFKAPIHTQIFGFPHLAEGNPDLEPETIDDYELIYIYKARNWKLNITGFYSQWKDAIIAETTTTGRRYVNKGKNDSIGGEINFLVSIEPFTGELGFSYVNSRALDVKDPSDPSGDKTTDLKYYAFPEYSIQAGIHYRLKPIDINFYLNNRIYLEMKETNKDMDPDPDDLPPYHRMDLNISKIIADSAEIYLDIRNILNRKNYIPSVVGAEDGIPEAGRSVLLRASYKL